MAADDDVRGALSEAVWIGPSEGGAAAEPGHRPAYLLRTVFDWSPTDGPVSCFATAHGIYEAYVNGERAGDRELTPGFTAYRKRLQVQTYDVTPLLRPGANTIAVLLSDGWFRGRHGFQRGADGWGARTALLLSLVAGESGSVGTLAATGRSWECRPSHILAADLMDGQSEDRRRYDPDWFVGGGAGWHPVDLLDDAQTPDPLIANRDRLIATGGPATRRIREIAPVGTGRPRAGTVVLDLGDELTGWMRLTDLGPAGTRLILTHGEVVGADGLVDTEHLRAFDFGSGRPLPAGQIDEVVSGGRPGDEFEPRHTTHGFRYVQIDGVPDGLDLGGARGVLVHDDLPRTGEFACSEPRLEQLHEVVRRSLLTNACAVPTDCPQRERSGFTGDWQVFVSTAAQLADVEDFSRRWLRDLAADQWADGRVPTIVPNPGGDKPAGGGFEDASAGSAGWGDAAAIVPWELWRAYGDPDALAESFPAMRRWVDYAAACAAGGRHPDRAAVRPDPAPYERYLWDTGFHFGEWLEPGVPPSPDGRVDQGIVATAYLHRSALIAARTAELLGRHDLVAAYDAVAEGARDAWRQEYLLADGRLAEERQAHYVRALAYDLVPAQLRPMVASRLAELVHEADDRLGTGFLATGMLLPALADNGHAELAYRLLTRTGQPSWLGMLDAGATTMWEWWDGIAPDGSVHGSLNHYSKGAVASFLHTHLAGLRLPDWPAPERAGYRYVQIEPLPGAGVTRAATRQQTRQGPLSVSWSIDGDVFIVDVELPATTTAEVTLPDGTRDLVVGGTHRLTCPAHP